MRKVVVYELLSLDGVAEDPDAFIAEWDDAMDANLRPVIATQDAVILGRRSYTAWAQFWPSSEIEPFATFINGVTKHVATSTPLDRDWANATVLDGGLVEFVRDLKQQPGGDVGVHASISVAQALLAAGVVGNELRLVIAPRIAGRGRRLLDGLPSIQLETIQSEMLADRPSARRLSRHSLERPGEQFTGGAMPAWVMAPPRRKRSGREPQPDHEPAARGATRVEAAAAKGDSAGGLVLSDRTGDLQPTEIGQPAEAN